MSDVFNYDYMFDGELSLRHWVFDAFPARVVDYKLLQDEKINNGISDIGTTLTSPRAYWRRLLEHIGKIPCVNS
uniref:Uncharacterized protein n=1 Tax=Oryza punctata TaxID=4537 RepID=A0A0E0K069_ORYPU